MERIKLVNVPRIFNMYSCYAGQNEELNTGIGAKCKQVLPMWHYCAECGTTFMVKHRKHPLGMFGYDFGEKDISCPNCGKQSSDRDQDREIAFCLNTKDYPNARYGDFRLQYAPMGAKLELFDTKNGVRLKATFRTIQMDLIWDNSDVNVRFDKKVEVIDFDLKHRKTVLKVTDRKPMEIGKPSEWTNLRHSSMLAYLAVDMPGCRGETAEKIKDFVKALRSAVRKKWKELHGFPMKDYITAASKYRSGGMILRQVYDIAYRMVCIDLPRVKNPVFVHYNTSFGYCKDVFENFDAIRKYKGIVPYLINAVGLPDKPSIRRILTKDAGAVAELKMAMSVTDNFDCNMGIYDRLNRMDTFLNTDPQYSSLNFCESLGPQSRFAMYSFLKRVSKAYSPDVLLRFVQKVKAYSEIKDLVNLSKNAPVGLFTEPLSKMHDVLVAWQNETEEEKILAMDSFDLDVPEDVKRRFVMQVANGMGRFFLPETNKDLIYTSKLMHNCVRTYTDSIQSQHCNIVYYTDDTGKLLACIEVRGEAVVQAKLKYNKHVAEDPAINQAILDWAKAKDLKIATADIELPSQEEDNRISA